MLAKRRGGSCRLPPVTVQTTLVALSETIDWHLAAYGVPDQWKRSQGEQVRVAVLDTGVDWRHPDLTDALEAAANFTGGRFGAIDRNGHGTHVAGIIAARKNDLGVVGVAPACRLLSAKVLDDRGAGSNTAVAAGVDWAVDQRADVLSLSLGSSTPSADLARAIERAVRAGCFVICAAGNQGRANSVQYPARWANTVAVGAVDRQGRVARFSSRGDQVDLCAPGHDVLSTWLDGGYARISGTSMAAPFVTGVVALALAKHRRIGSRTPLSNQRELLAHLRRTARDAGPLGHDPHYGFGLIDPASLLDQLAATTSNPKGQTNR